MDLMDVDTSKPWYVEERKDTYSNKDYPADVEFSHAIELVKDSTKSRNRIGNIVKINSSFRKKTFDDWKEWFLTKYDKRKRRTKIPWAPLYCSNEYGVIVNRYRIVKHKGYVTFRDYGIIIMMISGPKIGRVKRFYMATPYKIFCKFEDIPKLKKIKKPYQVIDNKVILNGFNINDLASNMINEFGVEEKARRIFVNKIYEEFARLKYV